MEFLKQMLREAIKFRREEEPEDPPVDDVFDLEPAADELDDEMETDIEGQVDDAEVDGDGSDLDVDGIGIGGDMGSSDGSGSFGGGLGGSGLGGVEDASDATDTESSDTGDDAYDQIANNTTDDPDKQGVIRTVDGANLVYKRQAEDGSYEELWMFDNSRRTTRNAARIKRDILSGTDIPVTQLASEDGKQSYEIWSAGNKDLIKIYGLPN